MSDFSRVVNLKLLENLKASHLFKKKLEPNLRKHTKTELRIFPAFRQQIIDFYYGGGRLYSFNNKGFSTHVKYGAVAASDTGGEYFYEDDYCSMKLPKNFRQAHKRIKENCRLYSGVEAEGVSRIYSKYSYLLEGEEYVVLDIEIALSSKEQTEDDLGRPFKMKPSKRTNRIDMLLYHIPERRLYFVEVKHHSNPEIRALGDPKVIEQLNRYNKTLFDDNQREKLIEQYGLYVKQANQLFDLSLPRPKSVENHVKLLIFGMDKLQLAEFKKTYQSAYTRHPVYHFQKPGSIILKHLWNELLWK